MDGVISKMCLRYGIHMKQFNREKYIKLILIEEEKCMRSKKPTERDITDIKGILPNPMNS